MAKGRGIDFICVGQIAKRVGKRKLTGGTTLYCLENEVLTLSLFKDLFKKEGEGSKVTEEVAGQQKKQVSFE